MLHHKSADGAPNHSIKWAQLFFFSLALIPWSQCRPMHVNAICQQGESLRRELQFALPRLRCFWPEERALFQPFGHQPQSRAIEVEDLQTRAPTVREDKERAAANVLLEPFANRRVQALEPFAHVHRLQANEHLQAAGKTQHDAEARALSSCAAKEAWLE